MRTFCVAIISLALLAVQAGGVAGQDEPLFGPMAPSRVAGSWVHDAAVAEGRVEQLGELMFKTVEAVGAYRVTSSDPRLGGMATATGGWTGWYPPALVAVVETSWLIEDAAGAWTGSSRRLASIGDEDAINAAEQVSLEGSGAYEGLTVYLIIESSDETFLGAIIPAEMPELPEDWMDIYQAAGGDGVDEMSDPILEADEPFPTRDIIVAAREIEAGATIGPMDLTLYTVPIDATNDHALTDRDKAVDEVAAITILPFQPITPNLLEAGGPSDT